MSIKIYNTLTGKKEDFRPIKEGKVGIYVCGMTVQEKPHIGHMRASVVADIFWRYLEYKGWGVTLIQNFTDIDDRVIEKAAKEGRDYRELAAQNEEAYLRASDQLGIRRATYYPRASQHIEEIIHLIESLVEKGLAYTVDGDVFYEVTKFKGYGKLSKKKIEDLKAGARVEVDPKKRSPLDFALWKGVKKGEPWWESPWGRGRPGWHIECSAMSMHYLGETLDIHAGGTDLIFPHHENEIAQSEAVTGKPFVNTWVHNEWVTLAGEKMSKSTGHFVPIEDILERYEPDVIRLYLLGTHYRSPLEFEEARLEESRTALDRLKNALSSVDFEMRSTEGETPQAESRIANHQSRTLFEEAMEDDFNTPKALGILFDLAKELNIKGTQAGTTEAAEEASLLYAFGRVLGLFQKEDDTSDHIVPELMDLIIHLRDELRSAKNFPLSDEIRTRLEDIGISLEDGADKTKWKKK
jgi:cysteinyl-tRNA synthetase